MEKTWTRLDEKNEFLGSSNQLAATVTSLVCQISTMTGFEVRLLNIGDIYQKKILELEEQFREKGLDYFSREQSEVRFIIAFDMLTNIKRATSILEKKLKWLDGFFLLNQITYFKAFSNRMIEWFLKDYIKEANAISNYSMEGNFAKSVMECLYSNNYDAMSPGSYKLTWEKGREILAIFGLQEQVRRMGPYAVSLVESQEKASLEYLKSWNPHV